MITLDKLRDDIVDAVIDVLIVNEIITDISDLQRVINPETGQVEIGRIDNEPIILSANDFQQANEAFISVVNNISTCLYIDNNTYDNFNPDWIEYIVVYNRI